MASVSGFKNYYFNNEQLVLTSDGVHPPKTSRYSLISNNNTRDLSQLQKPDSKVERSLNGSFLKVLVTYATGAFGLTLANNILIDKFVPSLVDRGICLNNIIPVSVMKEYRSWINPIIGTPTLVVNYLLGKRAENPLFQNGVLAPVVEEVQFRYLLQHLLLKKIPEHVLKKIAPNYAEIINHWPVQVLRAFVVALLFAVAHPQANSCESWGGMPQFISGLFFGLINEFADGGLAHTINLHMIHNMFVFLFN